MNRRYFLFIEDFLKSYDEESNEGYFLNVDVQYAENLHELYHGLPFLPERIKTEKVEKLVANLHDKIECVIQIRNLMQELNQILVFKNVYRVTEINQKAWLRPYVDMNSNLRKKSNIFENKFF